MDDSTPILVGAGQFTEKGVPPQEAHSPMGIAAEAAKAALDDSGCSLALCKEIDTLAVIRIFPDSYAAGRATHPFGRAENPPRAVARRIGADPERAIYCSVGGNSPQKTINEMAERISHGEVQVALITGSEAINTAQQAQRQGVELNWQEEDEGSLEDRGIGEPMSTEHERAHGLLSPILVYPLFENAIRQENGLSVKEQLMAMGEMFAPFTQVAAANPYAFYGTIRSAEELATVSTENRIIGLPYPKWMNARDSVNQGAAVVMTSVAKAKELSIDPSLWVFLHGCGDANDKIMVSERINYHSSPAMKLNSDKAFEMANKTVDDMDFIDIYSCFPSAVEVACDALGIDTNDSRGLTLTGGLPFFGGPGNNYSMHAIASMMPLLRSNSEKYCLISTNGGRLTKHSTGIYSAQPVNGQWQREDPKTYQKLIDEMDYPLFTESPQGRGVIETYTVVCNRTGPMQGIVIGRQENGVRFIANTLDDPETLQDFMENEQLGRSGQVSSSSGKNIFIVN